ncbi:MAG: cytochrome c oxidase assembly protein [Candidatus Dormibacteria bacterium]
MTFWGPWTHLYGYSVEPGVWIPALLSAWLYWRGQRQASWALSPERRVAQRWRAVAFYGGLAVIVVALESPVDYLSDSLFFMHMVQHGLLQMVAAPLVILGAPWIPMWRGLPLSWRRAIAPRALPILASPAAQAVRHFLRQPATCLGALACSLWLWHIPIAYDATLSNIDLHDFEHLTLLVGGLLFWSQMTDSLPMRRRLGAAAGAAYMAGGAVVMLGLAAVLGLVASPLYAPYADLVRRPLGLSAIADQRWGALVAVIMPAAMGVHLALSRWRKLESGPVPDTVAQAAVETPAGGAGLTRRT